jgi:hypothetical protein
LALEITMAAGDYAVYWHATGGKKRSGLLVGLRVSPTECVVLVVVEWWWWWWWGSTTN